MLISSFGTFKSIVTLLSSSKIWEIQVHIFIFIKIWNGRFKETDDWLLLFMNWFKSSWELNTIEIADNQAKFRKSIRRIQVGVRIFLYMNRFPNIFLYESIHSKLTIWEFSMSQRTKWSFEVKIWKYRIYEAFFSLLIN